MKLTKQQIEQKHNNSDSGKNESGIVQNQIIALLYDRFMLTAISNVILALLFSTLLWNLVQHNSIILWFISALLFFAVIPLVMRYLFQRVTQHENAMSYWRTLLISLYFIQGCIWALIALLFFVPTIFVIQVCLLIAVTIFYVNVTLGYKPVFYASVGPLFLVFSVRLVVENNSSVLLLALLSFSLFVIIFYSKVHTLFNNLLITAQQQRQKIIKLEQANLDKSRFLAATSHDLKQPLQAHSLYLDELKRNITGKKNISILHNLEQSTKAMSEMFDSLIDIAKIESGSIKPNWQCFPISLIFDELIIHFSALALDKDLTFKIVESSLIVKSDPLLLKRIIQNLVSNAIKYTASGGILIGCRRKNNNNHVAIEVWDSGIGISEKEQKIIFNDYIQLNNPEQQREKGIGLGLAIVKRLVKLLNHSLSVQSTINQGTVFSTMLTRANAITTNYDKKSFAQDFNDDIKDMCIVLTGKNNSNSKQIQSYLERWQCNVITAVSENDALKIISNNQFCINLIIADNIITINNLNACLPQTTAAILIGDTQFLKPNEAIPFDYKILPTPIAPDKLRSLLNYFINKSKLHK